MSADALPPFLHRPPETGAIGALTLQDSEEGPRWRLKGNTLAAHMAVAIFPGARKSKPEGTVSFPAIPGTFLDLLMMLHRFPTQVAATARDLFEEMFRDAVAEHLGTDVATRAVPRCFKGQLMPFQLEGVQFMHRARRSVLADDMGLGKTPQALALIDRLQEYPVAIIVQPHIITHWVRKLQEFLGARDTAPQKDLFATEGPVGSGPTYTVLRGQKASLATLSADIYVTHYLLLQFWDGWLRARGVRTVIFDECQEMRHTGTEKAKACTSLSRSAKYVAGLSGTPIYNYGIEIFQVINAIAPGSLGLKTHFQKDWCDGGGASAAVREPDALGAYLTQRRLMLRRRKDEVLAQLPAKRRVVEYIDGNESVFHKLVAKAASLAWEAEYQRTPFDKARMQAEAAAETRRATGVAKAPAVAAFVRGLVEAGEAPIVFAHHHAVVDELTMALSDLAPVRITGRETMTEKAASQAAFENGAAGLIIIGLRAATGLDGLQKRAKCVVFAELDWSPAIHWQAEDRAHRFGQQDSVLAYYLTIGFGSDPPMLDALGLKGQQFYGIMQDEAPTEADALAGQQATQEHMGKMMEMLRSRYPDARDDGSEAA